MTAEQRDRWHSRHPVLFGVLIAVGALLLVGVGMLISPWFDHDLRARPEPAPTFNDARARADALEALDSDDINPLCRSEVRVHGERTARSVLLLHGYTNCPAQFRLLASAYYDAGYNVVSVRLPGHGLSDRMTRELSDITPEDLVESADNGADIAAGLGERVSVIGLSAGGTLAAWLAAQRDDVVDATLIAPLVVPRILPSITVAPVARATNYLPDFYIWWDSEQKEALASPPYAYPRFSLKSLGSLLTIGRYAQGNVDRTVPLERLVIISTEGDAAVSNEAVTALAERLRPDARETVVFEFPAAEGYQHDLIDPGGDNAAATADIYRQLGPLIGLPNLAGYAAAPQ